MPIAPDLAQIYREAVYRVFLPGDAIVTLKAYHAGSELTQIQARHGAATSAFITACNPQGRKLGAAENTERMARLLAEVQGKWPFYPGEGSDRAGSWTDPSLLILGIGRDEALALGRKYDQHAILFADRTTFDGYTGLDLLACDPADQFALLPLLEQMAQRLEEKWKAEGIKMIDRPSPPDERMVATFPPRRKPTGDAGGQER